MKYLFIAFLWDFDVDYQPMHLVTLDPALCTMYFEKFRVCKGYINFAIYVVWNQSLIIWLSTSCGVWLWNIEMLNAGKFWVKWTVCVLCCLNYTGAPSNHVVLSFPPRVPYSISAYVVLNLELRQMSSCSFILSLFHFCRIFVFLVEHSHGN
jgi:hypothetical protein